MTAVLFGMAVIPSTIVDAAARASAAIFASDAAGPEPDLPGVRPVHVGGHEIPEPDERLAQRKVGISAGHLKEATL